MDEVWHTMYDLKRKRSKVTTNGNQQPSATISAVITLDQHVFKFHTIKEHKEDFNYFLMTFSFSFCIIIGRHYVTYLQLMGRNLFLRKRNGKVSMMESFKMLMKDVEFVQEVQINSGASHDETLMNCLQSPLTQKNVETHWISLR